MQRIFFSVLFLCFSLGLCLAAQAPTLRIVLLPVGLTSGLEPRIFLDILEERVEVMAIRKTNLIVPKGDDPRLEGIDWKAPMGLEDSLRIAKAFQAEYLITLDVRMDHRLEKRSAAQLLTVGGRAVVTITSVEQNNQVVRGPLVFHSDLMPESEGTPEFNRHLEDLTAETARDLASAIITETRGH